MIVEAMIVSPMVVAPVLVAPEINTLLPLTTAGNIHE